METVESLMHVIRSRRTCYRFEDTAIAPVSEQMLQNCLEAAIWAPNHKLTEPWRFWTLSKLTQAQLAPLYAKLRADKRAEPDSEAHQSIYQSAIEKFNKFPVVMFVGQQLAQEAITVKEDYAACACAIQNFQLMAWRQNMGVQWSTGPLIHADEVYELLGVHPSEVELIGILYIGQLKGDCSTQNGRRKPVSEVSATV